ncbi:Uncharacterized protein Adt_06222 [Abeliophyllum distichum]|uniref:Putative plant transposon protein domain-containing protein n=1 Tax=Abeliophyllum distichum TaxID=126358 RepID=A0ABD1V6C6_9LAMI
MPPRSKPTTSRKRKEIAEESNVYKRARPATPTYKAYVNAEAEQRATIFTTWSVIAEREVDLESLSHTTLSATIHDKGWTRLCSKPHSIYMEVVREFMVNFNLAITDEEDEHAYETVPEGSDAPAITNWNAVACNIYPIDNTKPWPQSNVICHGDMSDELRLFHSFMASNITPTTHLIEIYPAKMTILYLLATSHNFNFGEHIFNTITDLTSNLKGRSKLSFQGLISAPFHCHANVCRLAAELEEEDEDDSPANEDEPVESDTPIMPQRIRHRGGLNFGLVLDSIQATLQGHTGELQHLRDDQDELFPTL